MLSTSKSGVDKPLFKGKTTWNGIGSCKPRPNKPLQNTHLPICPFLFSLQLHFWRRINLQRWRIRNKEKSRYVGQISKLTPNVAAAQIAKITKVKSFISVTMLSWIISRQYIPENYLRKNTCFKLIRQLEEFGFFLARNQWMADYCRIFGCPA
jgi:hypothetical protein